MNPPSRRRVLLIGWGGADEKIIQPLLDRGEMPALERVITEGVMGELSTPSPLVSPVLWTSIATGKRAFQHGVHGFLECDEPAPAVHPVSAKSRRAKAVWEILSQNGLHSHVVGWPVTHPAAEIRGACLSDAFADSSRSRGSGAPRERSISPARLEQVLAELRVAPGEIDAAVMELFVPRFAEVDRARDPRLTQLAAHLADCASVQAGATWLMEHEPWDFAAVCFSALDRICGDFIEFHPPRLPGTSQRMLDLYGDVVCSAYRFLDLMLARLLQFTNPEDVVMIVSDHGYATGDLRPADSPGTAADSTAWQRPRGLLVMKGPGIRRDALVFGGNVLQITPTILSLFGLPAGEDMEGGVLGEAFAEAPAISRIATWEEENAATSDHSPQIEGRSESLADADRAVAAVKRQNAWNLALAYLDAEQPGAALPLLEGVYASRPERTDYAESLARCQMRLGRLDEAEETLQAIVDVAGDGALAQLLLGNLACERGNYEASLQHLRAAERSDPRLAGLHNQVGLSLSKLGQWTDAERAFRQAVEFTPEDPYSHLGLANALLRRGRYSEAAASALDSIGRRYHLPLAHITLGLALCGLREWPRAILALENAARLAPSLASPRRILARLYRR